MLNKNIHTFIGCDAEYEDSKIVLFGAGFDGTTSFRPGTRFAPSAIRNESFGIETYSPYQNKDMLDYCYLVNPCFPSDRLKDEMRANFDTLLTEYPSGMYVNSLLAGIVSLQQ